LRVQRFRVQRFRGLEIREIKGFSRENLRKIATGANYRRFDTSMLKLYFSRLSASRPTLNGEPGAFEPFHLIF
jgi:hypothetical protein